eukprot:gene11016-14795_t
MSGAARNKRKTNPIKEETELNSSDHDEENLENSSYKEEKKSANVKKTKKVKSDDKAVKELIFQPDVSTDEDDSENENDKIGATLKNSKTRAYDENQIESGQILRIYVQDFMNHRKLTIEFNRHLTFVTGKNGAGKSAIAVALQLCLGATARNTDRGSSLASLIREGSPGPAIIRVTLMNEGADAFMPEIYGKRITVERKIPKSGSATYGIFNSENREISRDKRDLEVILKNYNIYVDNPICVLTQEQSKKFIQGQDKEKYDFFLKATGLSLAADDIQSIKKTIEEVTVDQQKLEGRLAAKEADVKNLKDILERLTALDGITGKIRENFAKQLWFKVNASSSTLMSLESNVENANDEYLAMKEELNKMINSETDRSDEVEQLSESIEKIQQNQNTMGDSIRDIQTKVLSANREIVSIKADITTIDKKRKDFVDRLASCNVELNRIREKALKDAQNDEREVLEKINQVSRDMVELRNEEDRMREERAEIVNLAQQCDNEKRRMDAIRNRLSSEIRQLQSDLNLMRSNAGGGKAQIFGPQIPRILEEMRNIPFQDRKNVFGPLGMCISLKEGFEQFAGVVERAMGRHWNSFVVSNSNDQHLLKRLLSQRGLDKRIVIIIQPAGPRINVQQSLEPDIVTVDQALTIDADIVYNSLIDQTSLERIAIVSNEQEILSRYREVYNNQERLKYQLVACVSAADLTRVSYRNGNQDSEVNRYPFRNFLAKDMKDIIQGCIQNIQVKEQELNESNIEIQNIIPLRAAHDQKLRSIDSDLTRISNQLKTLNRTKQNLDNKYQEIKQAGEVDTSLIEEEIRELSMSIEQIEIRLDEKKIILNGNQSELKTFQEEKRHAENERQILINQLNELQRSLEKIINQKQDAKRLIDR